MILRKKFLIFKTEGLHNYHFNFLHDLFYSKLICHLTQCRMVIKEYNDSNPNTDRDMIRSHQLIYDHTLDITLHVTHDNNK